MAGTENIEFLSGDGEVLPRDRDPREPHDLIDVAPRRVPRAVVIGAVALALIVGAVAVSHRGPDGRAVPKALPSVSPSAGAPSAAASAAAAAVSSAARGASVGRVPLGDDDAVVDIAVAGVRLYVLQVDRLSIVDTRTHTVTATTALAASAADRLVLDAWNGRGWVVREGARPARIVAFDAQSGRVDRTLAVDSVLADAAALSSRLFLAASSGLLRLAPVDPAPVLIRPAGELTALAADASRGRLVLVNGTQVEAVTQSGRLLRAAPLAVAKADVTVTGATVWLAGFGGRGAVLRQLDPDSLRASGDLPPAGQMGAGVLIEATGARSVWLRSGGLDPDALWCRDIAGGPLAIWWTLAGRIASDGTAAYVAHDGVVEPIGLFSGCAG